jgi:hypothetical protein
VKLTPDDYVALVMRKRAEFAEAAIEDAIRDDFRGYLEIRHEAKFDADLMTVTFEHARHDTYPAPSHRLWEMSMVVNMSAMLPTALA